MLWQFQMGEGGHHLSVSCQMTVSNGFSLTVWICTELDCFHWQFHVGGGHHLSLFLQMTVSNGFSLTVWKHIAVTSLSNGGEGRGEDIGQSRFVCQI